MVSQLEGLRQVWRVLISTSECACSDGCGDFTSIDPDQMKLHPNQPVAQVAVVNGHQKVTGHGT